MKKKYIKDLTYGETIDRESFSLAHCNGVKHEKDIEVVFSDRTGTVKAAVPLSVIPEGISLETMEGNVFTVSGVILMDNQMPLLRVKELAVCSDFVPAELYQGLSKEKILAYIQDISELKCMIKHPGYRKLVDECLTPENLDKLAHLPATLGYYGKYSGGALAATDSVARMCMTSMVAYTKRGNGLTTAAPDWNALISASLLFMLGNIKYFRPDPPFKKSDLGVALGIFPALQSTIEDCIRGKDIGLTDVEFSTLLNALNVSVSTRTEVRAVSKEGPILRHCISLYAECDALDWECATHETQEGEDGYYYSKKLSRYVMTANGGAC